MHSPRVKLAALLLAALTLLPVATSCGTTTEETPATSTGAATDPTVTEAETEDPSYICDLPDNLNYQKEEINIQCMDWPARSDEFISESELGAGVISDAVYTRNLTVENQLNVQLLYTEENDDTVAMNKIQNMVKAGDNSMDIFTLGTNWSMGPALGGCYLNLNEVENIDLDKHYWSQDYNDMVTFTSERKQYLATCPAAISLFRLTYLTIFNRDLFADYKIPDLYETVKNGEWTLEYQNSILNNIWTDLDGNGKATEDDFFGFVTGNCISLDAYAVSSDISIIVSDEDGYLAFDKEEANKMIEMSERVSAIYTNQGTYFFPQQTQDLIGENNIIGKFAESECLMATTQFLAVETNFDSLVTLNYGVVPMPKLTVQQEDYQTYVQDQVTSFGISAVIADENRAAMLGAVLEAIAYHSNLLVRPAYYEKTLSLRFMQDPESRAILETMFETIAFDFAYCTGTGGVRDELRTKLCTATPGVANRIKAWERSIPKTLKRNNEAIDKLP